MENIHIEDIRYKKILKGGSIDIAQGEFVLICGRTGSGKTTLLKLLKEKAGTDAGYVMQNPDNQIIASVVEEDVGFGPENIGVPTDEIWQRVDHALKSVGMTKYRTHSPNKLSGGQKQRVAIIRSLILNPEIIYDEKDRN